MTKDTGVGNPKLATAEKGQKFFDAVTDNIGEFLQELHNANLDEMYQ